MAHITDVSDAKSRSCSLALTAVEDKVQVDASMGEGLVSDCTAGRVLRSIGECVFEWDMTTDTLKWSAGWENILALKDCKDVSSNRAFSALLTEETKTSRINAILARAALSPCHGEGVPYTAEYALRKEVLQSDADLWVEETGRWFSDDGLGRDARHPVRAHGVIRVITERRAQDERLDRLSRFDSLTGLLNRTMLNETVENHFKVMAESDTEAGFLLVGFDHFNLINSVYGYCAGDEVIQYIAGQIRANLRQVDTIGRFSGTRLGILLPDCSEREMMVAGHRILDMFGTCVVETSVGPIATSLSIGAVSIPRHALDMNSATVAAQQALVASRRNRDSSLVSFRVDPVREKRHRDAAKMAKRIVTALGDGHINLAWQPIVNAQTGETVFHEALLRLADSEGEPIAAKDFVGVAEELGLIRIVDHHALDLALAALEGCPEAVFSLNVCHDTASDPLWLSKLAAAVNRDKTLPDRLIVEITESHAAQSMEEALRFIHEVKGLGLRVALDDFGAGYTSFRNLKTLPFDIIKVDGQFVRNLASSSENQSFIRALVDLAGLFDAQVVVEWVEDEATAKLLREWGVDLLQGYLYGAPDMNVPWNGSVGKMTSVNAKSEEAADTSCEDGADIPDATSKDGSKSGSRRAA